MAQTLPSADGRYLAADQDDQNFVVYDRGVAVWDRRSYEATQPMPPADPTPPAVPGASRVLRVTDPSDGEVVPRTYSYWANAWWSTSPAAGDLVHVFWGHPDGHPRFAVVILPLGKVQRLGACLDRFGYTGTGEGVYWDAAGGIYLIRGAQLHRVNIFTGEDRVVLDITITHPGCDLWQAHSSDNGLVHSATVRRIVDDGPYPLLGTVVAYYGQQQWIPADGYTLDESQITTDGGSLLIKTAPDDDNILVTLSTGQIQRLAMAEGAVGHSDCGDRLIIGDDRAHGCCALIDLTQPLAAGRPLFPSWGGYHVAVRGDLCVVSDETFISRVALDGSGVTHLIDHGMVGTDYDHQVKANLDPAGRVACYLSNQGTDRQDVFLLIL